jgi:hypothetical protein
MRRELTRRHGTPRAYNCRGEHYLCECRVSRVRHSYGAAQYQRGYCSNQRATIEIGSQLARGCGPIVDWSSDENEPAHPEPRGVL